MIRPGDVIRDIRIVERLGEGGMGEVYLAVQEKIEREVAVKVIHAERRLHPSARARFEREAHILARLEHPNICRIYDCIDVDDQDLIVLELVRGRNLGEVIAVGVDEAEKMRLAEQVLTALEVAHSIGVIHRDLKPENIMVTEDGVVKVLDFGLARHVVPPSDDNSDDEQGDVTRAEPHESKADKPILTHFGAVVGTPRYFSPEQARGEQLTIASDIYSFGLVLQELWTGRPPYSPDLAAEELFEKAAWGDIEPVVGVDKDIASLIHDLTALAPHQRPSAAAVQERLRWIRRRPRRRAKRRLMVSAILALVLAAAASTTGFIHARRSQHRAEAARAEAEAVNDFLRGMLASAAPSDRGIDIKVIEILDEAAQRVEADLADHPEVRAAVHSTLGETYFALGQWKAAREHFEQASSIRKVHLGPGDRKTLMSEIRAATALDKEGRYEEAIAALEACHEMCGRLFGADDEITIVAISNLAISLQEVARNEEAEPLLRQELAWKIENLGEEHERTLKTRVNFANFLYRTGQRDAAAVEYREVFDVSRRTLGPNHPDTLVAEHNLASVLARDEVRAEDALPLYEDVIERRVRVLGEEHPRTVHSMAQEAVLLRRLGRYEAAEGRAEKTLEIRRRTLGDRHPDTIDSTNSLGIVLKNLGRTDEAEVLFRRALQDAESTLGPNHRQTLFILGNLSSLMAATERWPEAEAANRREFNGLVALYGPDHPHTLNAANTLSGTLVALGKTEEAESLAAETLERAEGALGLEDTRTLDAMGNYALVLKQQRRYSEAKELLRKVIEVTERKVGTDHPRARRARDDLAEILAESEQDLPER